MPLYADDPDVNVVYPVTDSQGADLTWSPVVKVAGHADITATWLGTAGPTRDLRVPLTGLAAGRTHALRLVVPGDNDIHLGHAYLT